jgi:hypothetical protein
MRAVRRFYIRWHLVSHAVLPEQPEGSDQQQRNDGDKDLSSFIHKIYSPENYENQRNKP